MRAKAWNRITTGFFFAWITTFCLVIAGMVSGWTIRATLFSCFLLVLFFFLWIFSADRWYQAAHPVATPKPITEIDFELSIVRHIDIVSSLPPSIRADFQPTLGQGVDIRHFLSDRLHSSRTTGQVY